MCSWIELSNRILSLPLAAVRRPAIVTTGFRLAAFFSNLRKNLVDVCSLTRVHVHHSNLCLSVSATRSTAMVLAALAVVFAGFANRCYIFLITCRHLHPSTASLVSKMAYLLRVAVNRQLLENLFPLGSLRQLTSSARMR